jgi:hypothetical protein
MTREKNIYTAPRIELYTRKKRGLLQEQELPSTGDEIKKIVNEWDTMSILYLLDQTK